MSVNGEVNNLYSGKNVARNTVYNFLGMGLPLIVAVVLIPPLINGFGEERFGLLNLAWVVIGYFSLFDLGIGRTLTKVVAEKLGLNKNEEIPSLFWTSMFMMLGVSIAGMVIFFFLSPVLVYDLLNISENLREETLSTFYLLAFSIPVVTTSAGLRGVIEAYQKFNVVNVIRVIIGVFTLAGPLLSLLFTESLFWVVIILIILRLIVWLVYFFYCLRLNPEFKRKISFNTAEIKPIMILSGWITLTNILAPVLIYSDRFFIGGIASAAAITYYATPYEFVTRMWLIPSAIVGVLFPAFSASYISNPEYAKKLYRTGLKFVFFLIVPVCLTIFTFSYEGLYLWLGREFAEKSTPVLQLLSLGVIINSLGFFPFTFLQSTGRAKTTGLVMMFELPVYLFLLWLGIKHYGITGAAFVWMLRMLADTGLLLFFTNRILRFQLTTKYFYFLPVVAYPVIIYFTGGIIVKGILLLILLTVFAYMSWKYFIQEDEKNFMILNFLKRNYNGSKKIVGTKAGTKIL